MISKLLFGITLMTSLYFYNSNTEFNINTKKNYLSVSEVQQQTSLQKSITRGNEIYTDFCMQCHLSNGKGNGTTFPPLDGSDWLKKKSNQSIHAIKYGLKGEIVVNQKKFNSIMPPMGLSDEEIADVMNYVSNSWTNKSRKMITAKEVSQIKQ